MAEERSGPRKSRKRPLKGKDISHVLAGWDYEAGTINVRKILGEDGEPRLQMRLDLGLLQMHVVGRPDGTRPFGCESLLDYHEKRLKDYRRKNGTEIGFALTNVQCQGLREEALMYYHRYLSLFVLGEFRGVARDTSRNLRVLDLCGKYAADEGDRLILEQYRPYILMMNTRAMASLEAQRGKYRRAVFVVKQGLREIKEFFKRFGQEQAYRHASEVKILKQFGRELRQHLPVNPVRELRRQLVVAIRNEHYEEAAKLRDEIERIQPGGSQI